MRKSKTVRYYSIENDRFNIRVCQSWACANFLLGYIIQFFFFYPQNYIFFVRQSILFPDQRKYFDSKRTACKTIIL